MATNTPNLNLIKPGGDDPINVQDFNDNSDILDSVISNIQANSLPVATTAEAVNGVIDNKVMTPLKTKEAIDNSNIIRIGSATGTNSLVLSATPLFDDLYAGLTIKFKNTTENTGNVTVNVNSKGVKSVLDNEGNQLKPGALKSNSNYEITYDGVNFFLSKGGGGSGYLKRVQRFSTSFTDELTKNIPLQSVDVSKTIVKVSVNANPSNVGTVSSQSYFIRGELANSNTLTLTRAVLGNSNPTCYIEVIEFESPIIVNSGFLSIPNGQNLATVSVPISDITKSFVIFSETTSLDGNSRNSSSQLNSGTLTFRRASSSGVNMINWYIVTQP